METKKGSLIIAFVVLISAFYATLTTIPETVKATTLFVGGGGPGNYTTIQNAIDAANPGDTVYVYKGTYYESVTVPKALNLIGEDRNMTVINGSGWTDIIYVNANSVNITGFNITFGYSGIVLESVSNCVVVNNTIWNTDEGILLEYSGNISLGGNTIFSNRWGDIVLYYSDSNIITENSIHSTSGDGISLLMTVGNTIANNSMVENGIFISGDTLEQWNTHSIDISNTVNGKPVYYWRNSTGGTIPPGAGQVVVVNSTLVTIRNQVVSNGSVGVQLAFSEDSTISGVNASGNFHDGIHIYNSHNNTIVNNSAWSNNFYSGIYVSESDRNDLANNTASSNGGDGIRLSNSHSNTISDNTVQENYGGVTISSSGNTTLVNNMMKNDGISIFGELLEHWNTHIIDTSNTVNGKPVYYMKNVTSGTIPLDAGQAIVANATGVIIENLTLKNTSAGIQLGFSSSVTISNVNVSRNVVGIVLTHSNNNAISGNNASNNTYGIELQSHSNGNTIFDNTASGNIIGLFIRLYSEANTILNNTVLRNREGLYSAYYTSNNSILNNDFSLNSVHGIRLSSASYHLIANNTVLSNEQTGIMISSFSHNNTIKNNTASFSIREGITLQSSENNTVEGNDVSNNPSGIQLVFSDNNSLTDNSVLQNRYGISLVSSHDNWIASNNVSSNDLNAIELYSSRNNTIADNTVQKRIFVDHSYDNDIVNNRVSGGWPGIRLEYSDRNMVAYNSVSNNGDGVTLYYSNNNTVHNNTASLISRNAFALYNSNNNTLSNNTASITTWGTGIFVQSSNSNVINNNTISLNDPVGIYLEFSEWNRIYHNRFIGNTMQAYDSSDTNQWDNGYPSGGNYWSDYAGYDMFSGFNQDIPGSDGFGDTPYVIDSDSIDRYPLMTPYQLIGPISPYPLSASLTGRDLENVTLMWALSPDDGQGLKSVVRYDIFRNTGYDPEGIGYSLLASVPNGTSVFTDVQAGEGNPDNYYYRVCAVDFGNGTRCSAQQLGKFTRPLSKGPNLVSIPLIQSDESIQTILQTVSYDNAWSYDAINQEWRSFSKSKPYGQSLEYLNHTMGIWVNVTQDSNLTVAGVVPTSTTIDLQAGWNLVGFPSFDDNYTVADLKAVVAVERIEGFDALAPPYFLRAMADGDFLQAGFGYWIRVETPAIWTVENV